MKIAVAHKWAQNPQEAQVAPDGTVDLSRAKAGLSEYDPVAIELARALADATGAELVGLSVGGPDAGSPMARKASLSRGLDRLVVVTDPALAGARATATAQALAAAVHAVGEVDVVVTGDSSVDEGAHLVPAVLAGLLGRPLLTEVTAVALDGGVLRVEQAVGSGSQVVEVTGPVVLAASTDAVLPRVPGMKDILGAGKKPTEEVAAPELTPDGLQVVGRARPALADRRRIRIDANDPQAAAAELVAALRADGVL